MVNNISNIIWREMETHQSKIYTSCVVPLMKELSKKVSQPIKEEVYIEIKREFITDMIKASLVV